jgi:hypothetical protein
VAQIPFAFPNTWERDLTPLFILWEHKWEKCQAAGNCQIPDDYDAYKALLRSNNEKAIHDFFEERGFNSKENKP